MTQQTDAPSGRGPLGAEKPNATLDCTPSAADIQHFLELLYGDAEDGYLVLSRPDPTRLTRQGKPALKSKWYDLAATSLEQIAAEAAARAADHTIYHGVVIQHRGCIPTDYTRGKTATAYLVPGLWYDLDIATGRHAKNEGLPATLSEAMAFLLALPAVPSLIVHTGGGVHAYWLFRELYRVTCEDDRTAIADLSEQFTFTLNTWAREQHGWTPDALGDLARVLRPVGTINHKYGALVTVTREGAERYNPSDLEQWLVPMPTPVRTTTGSGEQIAGQPDLVAIAEAYGTTLEGKSKTELAGPHPQHGSSTGDNFNISLDKGLWHCWRHGTGGDALALIAVCEGLIDCEQARSGALSGTVFKRVVEIANDKFSAGIALRPGPAGDVAPPPPDVPWPILAAEALYGLAGNIVRAIDPYTEADKVATLMHTLVAVGNIMGSGPHARVQHDMHPTRLDAVLVGESSKGRKGTSWSTPRYLLSRVDEAWATDRIKSGLSSGEGLIYHVRDAISRQEPIKEKGRVVAYQQVEVDPGESDKRLLVIEPEFAATLTVMSREGNILSAVIRQAWDSGNLSPLTKSNPIRSTGAHVSIIGHITRQELLTRLDDTSRANGFCNRFLWCLVRRSKELPEGADVPDHILNPLVADLARISRFSRTVGHVQRDDEAKGIWREVYGPLSAGKPGLFGAIISRAEAQVLRLSVLYALMDASSEIRRPHLLAALAVWDYCEQSARFIFGTRLGDPTADRILEAVRLAGEPGMTDSDMHDLFGRHRSSGDRTRAVSTLMSLGLIVADRQETGGRPRTVYRGAR